MNEMDEAQEAYQRLVFNIQNSMSQRFMAAYLAAIGGNIHVGEKRARKLGIQAGVVAMKNGTKDFETVEEEFGEACNAALKHEQDKAIAYAEAQRELQAEQDAAPKLIVPDHLAD